MSGITHGFNEVTPSYIGAMCSNYRRYFTKFSQQDVADYVGCARETVSKFERGHNCNGVIFLWYIKHGIFNWVPMERWNGWDMGM